MLLALLVLAFNLRPAAASVGPLVQEVETGLGLSAATAGLLTSLPVLAFAAFGGLAPWLASRLGVHRLTTLALAGTVVGLGWRAVTSSPAVFLLASVIGLAGMATANVLLPSLVKLHFPTRVGLVTSLYTTVLALEFSPLVFQRFGLTLPLRLVRAIYVPLVILGVLLSTMHQS